MELGKMRCHREIYLVRFAGSGVSCNVLNASGRFRREDIADCLLVSFDFFFPPSLSGNARGERDLCREAWGIFFFAHRRSFGSGIQF